MTAFLRFGYQPLRGFIATIGAMVLLFRRTAVAALTPPYNYGPELVDQFLFALRLGWLLVTVSNHAQVGPFFSTFFAQATTSEFLAMLIKSSIFGAMIAIVCCYKGLTASGGAEGVGRAVNQAVVIAFLGIGAIDYTFTQTLLATHPALNTPR